jgi:hypothetical protein
MFPFELSEVKDHKVNLVCRSLLILALSFMGLSSMYFLISYDFPPVLTYYLALGSLFNCFLFLALYLIPMRFYHFHIVISSLFFSINLCLYLILGIYFIRFDYSLILIILSFLISFILLILIFCPYLKKWSKLEKKEDEYTRSQVNFLAFNECINIFFFILIYLFFTLIILL